MKKFFLCLASAAFMLWGVASAQTKEYPTPKIDFSGIASMPHPRLFVTPEQMADLKASVQNPKSEAFRLMNKALLEVADKYVEQNKTLVFKKDVSGRRLLSVSRDALARIFDCAYAYNVTGDMKYAQTAFKTMADVCSFHTWNPSHYLDVAEMSLGVAIGYDWLYDVLPADLKKKAEDKMYEYGIQTTIKPEYSSWSKGIINWNQVCHAGGVALALALYEQHPEEAQFIINRAIPSNARAVEACYAPDGIYPEGAGYWAYGSQFQIILNSLLTRAFGTDFGLSDIPGFSKTGEFFMFSQGNLGMKFDYADTGSDGDTFFECFYFADRFNDPSQTYLYNARSVKTGQVNASSRIFPIMLVYASRLEGKEIPQPEKRVFTGESHVPIVIARTGWDKDDLYLGIKGGRGSYNHNHLDAGSFVFEAKGVRWASEVHAPGGYAPIEKSLMDAGISGGMFNGKQDSYRWKMFTYANTEHNTLTINNKIHQSSGEGIFSKVIDEPNRIGATINLTAPLGSDIKSAERTVVIVNDSYLEVTDVITAGDSDVEVRFNFVTDAVPSIKKNSIRLVARDSKKTAKLEAKGINPTFTTWSVNPKDYPNAVNSNMEMPKEKAMCGYTYKVSAGTTATAVTTIKVK